MQHRAAGGRAVAGGLPEHPAKALQVVVSRARAQLGADVIASTPTGYRLSLAEEQVDTSAVLLRAAASARQARAGDHAALAQAEAGLALFAGAPDGADAGLDDQVAALRAERRRPTGRWPGPAPWPCRGWAATPRRPRRWPGWRERQWDEEVMAELLRCEAATLGPSAALARYRGVPPGAAGRGSGTDPGPALQALQQQLLAGTAPPVRHGVPGQPAAGPRRRHRRPGRPAALVESHLDRRARRAGQDPARPCGEPPGHPAGRPGRRPGRGRRRRRRGRRGRVGLGAGESRSPGRPVRPADRRGRRHRGRLGPVRPCWCWTTASTSWAVPPTWSARWCR